MEPDDVVRIEERRADGRAGRMLGGGPSERPWLVAPPALAPHREAPAP